MSNDSGVIKGALDAQHKAVQDTCSRIGRTCDYMKSNQASQPGSSCAEAMGLANAMATTQRDLDCLGRFASDARDLADVTLKRLEDADRLYAGVLADLLKEADLAPDPDAPAPDDKSEEEVK